MFTFNIIMSLYWSSIHPLIQGLCYIFLDHDSWVIISLYCYGLVMLIISFLSLCLRCWILYFNYHYNAFLFEKLWVSHLLKDHYSLSWYEKNRNKWGKIGYILPRAILFCTLLVAVPVPLAWHMV